MTHRQKVECLIVDLGRRGVGAYTVAPPLFRLLWLLGLEVPPPLFLGFGKLTLGMGVPFGLFWGAFMWLVQWRTESVSVEAAALASVAVVVFFGLSMAAYYRWKAKRLGLPSWANYPEPALPNARDV